MGKELKGTHFLKAPQHIQNTGNRKDLQPGSKKPVCIPPALPCRTGESLCPPNHTSRRIRFVVTVTWGLARGTRAEYSHFKASLPTAQDSHGWPDLET